MTNQTLGTTARVATLAGPRTVVVRDQQLSALSAGQVRLRTLYSGISAGTEMNVYRGSAVQWRTRRADNGLFEPAEEPDWTYPMVYGYAAVSTVQDIGADVDGLQIGDLVFSYSPHASATVLDAKTVVPLPPLADPRVGVLNANLNTAYNGILDAHVNLGDVVVVSGLGVIGLIQVQLLQKQGVQVIAVDSIAERRALAEHFGATTTLEPGPDAAGIVRNLTDNRGADVVIEVSGNTAALNEAIRIAGYCGTIIAMSWYGGTFENLNLSGEFHHNRPRIISSQVGGLNPHLGPLWSLTRRQQVVLQLMQELDLAPLITHERNIEAAADAYRIVDARPSDLVQMILTY